MPNHLLSRCLPGMTYRATLAYRKIVRMEDALVTDYHAITAAQAEVRLILIEKLIAEHFPMDAPVLVEV